MKKIILILLCFALTVGALVSCDVKLGDSDVTDTKASVTDKKSENGSEKETDKAVAVETDMSDAHTEEVDTEKHVTEEAVTEDYVNESSVNEEISDEKETQISADATEEDIESTEDVEKETQTDSVTEEPEEITEKEEETVSPYLAPDFTVYDINGNSVKLSDYRGKPIVLNFWARDCIYCTMEMPDFQAAYEKYGDRVEFLMVCFTSFSNKGVEYEKEYIDSHGYTFTVFYDTSDSAVYAYGINSIPHTFFINSDFDLYTYIPGMATAEALETCIGYIIE